MYRQTKLVANYDLPQRWPDLTLSKAFRELLIVYHKVFKTHLEESGEPATAVRYGYETICRWIQQSLAKSSESRSRVEGPQKAERIALRSLVSNLKESYGPDWLQSVASLLGMLMHFSSGRRESNLLVNHRRPKKPFSTYPTSPAVAKLVGDAVVKHLLKEHLPAICHHSVDAERYAERALTFRILDPSMESGQLLLEVALAFVGQVHRKHSPDSRTAKYLIRAILEKLCRDCLWGIDRNELATRAVSLIFSLLGTEFRMQQLTPAHLLTANALECFNQGQLSRFDCIVNNPPWGKVLRPTERRRLRRYFSTLHYQSDTYVAFSELAIQCLQSGGIFALILPSQAIAARNAARLREAFLCKTELDQIMLLPHSAFANATVRGVVLLGRVKPTVNSISCHVTTYPIVKRLDTIGPARSIEVATDALRRIGKDSWWPLLNSVNPVRSYAQTIPLEKIATVACGVQVYCKGRGVPPQTADIVSTRSFTCSEPVNGTIPAVRGSDLRDFYVRNPQEFVKFGRWLARAGNHDLLRRSTRIFVRELCRRDGKLTAAAARDGFIPLHGVLTIVPKTIDAHALVGILNSTAAAEYVRMHTASFSKVDFQKITVGELRKMPIPIAAIDPSHRSALGLRPPTKEEGSLRKRVIRLARKLSCEVSIKDSIAVKRCAEVDAAVAAMYGNIGGKDA